MRPGPAVLLLTTCAFAVRSAQAQAQGARIVAHDSVTIAAGAHYRASGFHRFLFGGTYRDLWTTPIRVPVLDLQSFHGGLTPKKLSGGNQTKSLRFTTPSGVEYVFRSVDKDRVTVPEFWQGSAMEGILLDQTSSSFPGAAVLAAPILDAAGVMQTAPSLVVMPDDPALGQYQKEFAGRLGMIELSPTTPAEAPGAGGIVDVIGSDSLLVLINSDPAQRVDARAFLAARLVDMLLNDYDRHPGQWSWARVEARAHAQWEPIPRDRDKVFIGFTGFLPGLAGSASPDVIRFSDRYPSMSSLTRNSVGFDRRMLSGLEKSVWDSVAAAVRSHVTDASIDAALARMPVEYRGKAPELGRILRVRRDALLDVAKRFYAFVNGVVDIHATDAADLLSISRVDDRHVDVALTSGNDTPYFRRRFDASETSEIRVYLHGGDDKAIVTGTTSGSIPVRVIGGNGTNTLIDSSSVGGRHNPTHGYDLGTVSDVLYGVDTLFGRRPLVHPFGELKLAPRDYGAKITPVFGFSARHDLGMLPRFGLTRTRYGFGTWPYSSKVELEGRYSFRTGGTRFSLIADHRREYSPWHYTLLARTSQLELVNFHGYGNSSPESATDYFRVDERQTRLEPAIALAISRTTDLRFGPVVQYSKTVDQPDRYIAQARPYGFGSTGSFGEAGMQFALLRDARNPDSHARKGTVLDMIGAVYPAVWDVRKTFATLTVNAAIYHTFFFPTHPWMALKVGGRKVFGDVPVQEAAFIGGAQNVRILDLQRYAGDASLTGTLEVRIPLFRMNFLAPIQVGLLGAEDIGRVYVHGESPGGWHNTFAAGFWATALGQSVDIKFFHANERGRPPVILVGLARPIGGP